ncbi:MAG: sialate O-acetylesterase [Verrucomicrobiota bacterium]
MNSIVKFLATSGLLALVFTGRAPAQAAPPAPNKNFHIYLCFGQSNMEGFPIRDAATWAELQKDVDPRFQLLAAVDFTPSDRSALKEARKAGAWYVAVPPLCRPDSGLSPVDFFGRTLVANLPKEIRVGVVSVAVAGCKIETFDKVGYQAEMAKWAPGDFKVNIAKQYGGNPYQRLVELGKEAQKTGVIKGILLHQGESNSGDKEWPNKVKAIYEDLLKDLNLKAAEVPLLAGEVVAKDQGGGTAGMNAIIDELPKAIPTAHVISAEGCTPANSLHFDPAGYRELGTRYAVAMIPLLGLKPLDRQPVIAPPRPAAPARGGRGRGQGAPPAAPAPATTAPGTPPPQA